jgi:DnaJ-domain-containing protein 1
MLDIARLEARSRARIAAFLQRPDTLDRAGLAFAAVGYIDRAYAAASCLALRGDWPGPSDSQVRRALWSRFSLEALPPDARVRRGAERIVDVVSRAVGADLPALARLLATSDAAALRRILADWAFALAALGGQALGSGEELVLRAALSDCGVGAAELLESRSRAFPGERDPWSVLGLAPGAPRVEVKRAYRRLSRAFHPDASPGDDGARFRELQQAYAALASSSR